MSKLDPENRAAVAKAFDIAGALAAEIVFTNDDEWNFDVTPERRWERMHAWVAEQIIEAPAA